MTISSPHYRPNQYLGSGITGPFTITWDISDENEAVVTKITNATGVTEVLTLASDYTVTVGVSNSYVTLMVAIDSDYDLLIERDIALTQELDLPAHGDFSSKNIETALDKLTKQNQDQAESIERSIRVSSEVWEGSSDIDFEFPSEPGSIPVVNTAGDGLTAINLDEIGGLGNIGVVATIALLRTKDGTVYGYYQVLEIGKSGFFTWDSSDLSTEVTNDPNSIVYVAPDLDLTGASGAWVITQDKDTFPSVDTIADLRNYPTNISQKILVLGYTTKGDGGGGPLRYLSNTAAPGTYVDNGFSIVVPSGGDGSVAWLWEHNGSINAAWCGADITGVSDSSPAIQKALDTGGDVFIDGSFIVDTALNMLTRGQVLYSNSINTEIKANAAMTEIISMTTSRWSKIKNIKLNGNNLADYCVKLDYPKQYAIDCEIVGAKLANVWMGYFTQELIGCIITDSYGHGVLVKDNTGQVNDNRIKGGSISGNAKWGILHDTASRDGIWIEGINMEQNNMSGGYGHIKIANSVKSTKILNTYHECSLGNTADSFIDIGQGVEDVQIQGCKLSDGSSSGNMSYLIKTDITGKNISIDNCWLNGYGTKAIENNLNTSNSNSLFLGDITVNNDTISNLVSSGQAVTFKIPRGALSARRMTSNQTFSTITNAIFNEAQGQTVQGSVDTRIEPSSYSITTGEFIVFDDGIYSVSPKIGVTAPGVGIYYTVSVYNGGSLIVFENSIKGNGTDNVSVSFNIPLVCAVGDTLTVKLTSSSGSLTMRINESSLLINKIGTLNNYQN